VAHPAVVFDLGASDGSDVAANKDAMIAGSLCGRVDASRDGRSA